MLRSESPLREVFNHDQRGQKRECPPAEPPVEQDGCEGDSDQAHQHHARIAYTGRARGFKCVSGPVPPGVKGDSKARGEAGVLGQLRGAPVGER